MSPISRGKPKILKYVNKWSSLSLYAFPLGECQ